MPRYIDADTLKESLKNLKAEGSNQKYVQGLQDAIDGYFPQIIDDVPTADVEPVRHGQWIHKSEDYSYRFECSACKTEEIDIPTLMGKPLFDYCPYCGAKMYGGVK